jgi:hypothetical protein
MWNRHARALRAFCLLLWLQCKVAANSVSGLHYKADVCAKRMVCLEEGVRWAVCGALYGEPQTAIACQC